MRTERSFSGEMCAYWDSHRALGMGIDSGMIRNLNTEGSWEGGQEEAYDGGLKKRWKEWNKKIPLSWKYNMEHWWGSHEDA